MDWFRLYGDMPSDPKIGTLNDAEFRTWVELMCAACKHDKNGDTGLSPDTINWVLRRDVTVTLPRLLERDLVTVSETGNYVIKAWDKRQYKSDTSAERTRKYREKRKTGAAPGPSDDDVTQSKRHGDALDTETEPDTDTETDIPVPGGTDAKASGTSAPGALPAVPTTAPTTAPEGITPADALFQIAVPWLVSRDVPDKSARSLLGGARKQLGDEGAWALASECMTTAPLEPAAWLAAALNKKIKTTGGNRHGNFAKKDYDKGVDEHGRGW